MPKVLIVDDERACCDSLRMLLKQEQLDVQTAVTGGEALEMAAVYKPDVLVVDWLLNDHLDGLQVVAALQDLNPKLQAIVVTGYLSEELENRIRGVPAVQFFAKPYVPDRLVAAVHHAAKLAAR